MEIGNTRDVDIDGDGDVDFRDAAIRAEIEIGHREDSTEQAWHHVLVRLGRISLGFLLVVAGIAMMVLPGPGAIVLAAGLVVWSKDFAWADRALRYLRKKVPGLEEEGPIPKSTIVVSVMLMVAAVLMGFWWVNGGSDTVSGWF